MPLCALWVAESPRSPEISNLRSRAFTPPRPRYTLLQRSVHARTRPLNPLRDPGLLTGPLDVALEVLALPKQLAVLKRKLPRPLLNALDRLFRTTLSHFWPRWMHVLEIVKSKTAAGWHRASFRIYRR